MSNEGNGRPRVQSKGKFEPIVGSRELGTGYGGYCVESKRHRQITSLFVYLIIIGGSLLKETETPTVHGRAGG